MFLFGIENADWGAVSQGGTATAVIIVVMLFLKHIRDNNLRQEKILKAFELKIEQISEKFQEQITVITDNYAGITSSSIGVQVKVEASLNNLERRVDGLAMEIGHLKGERHGSHK